MLFGSGILCSPSVSREEKIRPRIDKCSVVEVDLFGHSCVRVEQRLIWPGN